MLDDIIPYISQFTNVIAAVTGIDAEVVDSNLIRLAGTGNHAEGIGKKLKAVGRLYSYSLNHHETLFVENPKEHHLCHDCPDWDTCQERLTMCAPIIANGAILGIIALLCYNDEDRGRVLKNRDVYVYFVRQMADAIARVAQSERSAKENRQRLDMLLKITDSNDRGVIVLDKDRRISFINDSGKQKLGIESDEQELVVTVTPTGGDYSNMKEFEVALRWGGADTKEEPVNHVVLGSLSSLDINDPMFCQALVFEPKQRFTEMVSHLGSSSGNTDMLSSIIGDSSVMQVLKKRVVRIAETSSTVLITGESGTGKEMFARVLHAASDRKSRPFVAINCGAIPDALLESELFGYVKGAFTDADPSGRIGKFELADKGVLFLDEISSMPLYLQVKLLRILQERTFTRLGSNKPVEVDLRIIAATNEDLLTLIKQKRFREDLYYRLNVIPLELPPLRERREDIPVLATSFMERYCRLYGKPAATLSGALLDALSSYAWPGNIRELENCMEYMVHMYDDGQMLVSMLPQTILDARSSPDSRVVGVPAAAFTDESPVMPLAEIEQRAIAHTLARFGNTTQGKRDAAKALGISLGTLYRKLKE